MFQHIANFIFIDIIHVFLIFTYLCLWPNWMVVHIDVHKVLLLVIITVFTNLNICIVELVFRTLVLASSLLPLFGILVMHLS